jgi:rSAM/selenodomain-associated transferase 2
MAMKNKSISVIIPTLNEQASILPLLKILISIDERVEIIVVDGGSQDNTKELASKYARTIDSERGRGIQQNEGAKIAKGNILWFIHADSIPHPDSIKVIIKALSNKDVVGGAFSYKFSDAKWYHQLHCISSNLKNRTRKNLFGDMGIFVRRDVFTKMEGFKESLFMEDVDFSKRLKKHGQIKILKENILTSARDWEKEGFFKKIFKDSFIKLAYQMKFDNQKLYHWYYGK